jgi:hypothetical protein
MAKRYHSVLDMVWNVLYGQVDERGQTIHQLERKLGKMNRKSAAQHRTISALNRKNKHVVCVYAKNPNPSLVAVIDNPDNLPSKIVVTQWLRVNGYLDDAIDRFTYSNTPVIAWDETIAGHPAID